jgi:hypothetical protein
MKENDSVSSSPLSCKILRITSFRFHVQVMSILVEFCHKPDIVSLVRHLLTWFRSVKLLYFIRALPNFY